MAIDTCNEQFDGYPADRSWLSYLWTTLGSVMFVTMVVGVGIVYAKLSPASASVLVGGSTLAAAAAGGY